MRNGHPTDYAAPFLDVPGETPEQAADRIAKIGGDALLAWWERVKHDTSPATYGHTDHDEAGTIAFCLDRGYGPPKFRDPTDHDDRKRAARLDCLQRLRG